GLAGRPRLATVARAVTTRAVQQAIVRRARAGARRWWPLAVRLGAAWRRRAACSRSWVELHAARRRREGAGPFGQRRRAGGSICARRRTGPRPLPARFGLRST